MVKALVPSPGPFVGEPAASDAGVTPGRTARSAAPAPPKIDCPAAEACEAVPAPVHVTPAACWVLTMFLSATAAESSCVRYPGIVVLTAWRREPICPPA